MKLIAYLLILLIGVALGYWSAKTPQIEYQITELIKTLPPLKEAQYLSEASPEQPSGTPTKKSVATPSTYEPEILLKKAQRLIKQQRFLAAIKALENLYIQVDIPYSREDIAKKIQAVAQQYLAKQSLPDQIELRIQLLEELRDLLPNSLTIRQQLAEEYLKNSNYYQARTELVYLQNNPYWQKQAKKLKQAIEEAERFDQGDIKIPLIYRNNSYFIRAEIEGKKEITLLLDTGANLTILKKRFINIASLDEYDKKPIQVYTANGLANIFKIKIKQFRIANVVDEEFEIGIIADENLSSYIDGLLGTDWLNRFLFEINQEKKLLILNKKPS